MRPEQYRRYFAWAFFVSSLLLIYASILPVQFQHCTFDDAMHSFSQLPWLKIQLYGRADWVANLLVVLPLGWFAAAAIDCGRASQRLLFLLMPFLVILLCLLVVGIEFLQAWFPNRTQSLNDIAAGCVGALIGPVIWLTTGRWTMRTISTVAEQGVAGERLRNAAVLYAAASLVFAVLPLDVVVTLAELRQKASIGRLEIFPEFDFSMGLLKTIALTALRIIPLTLLLCFAGGFKRAVFYSVMFAVVCELIQVPIYSRHASLFHALVSICAALCVALLCQIRWSAFPILRSSAFWLTLSIASSLGLLATVVMTAERVVRDPQELADRWRDSFHWPLAGYYHQAEFSALTTLVYKSIIFTWIGGCCGIAVLMASDTHRKMIRLYAVVLMLVTAVTAELSQVYLPPHIPAAFDSVLYFATMLGVAKFTSQCVQKNKLIAQPWN